jgi:glycosyltransferase involved in cell wall biosynthesis
VPRFSIVVPAYQAASTLTETLDAILAQAFGDWECVVVDDGSTDDTLGVASAYASGHPRIRVIHQDNQGTAGAYNAGVSSAAGDFIVLCSADDILLPEHLSRMSAFIDGEDGYDIYSSNGYFWRPGESRELCYGPGLGQRIHSLELGDVIRRCFYSVGAAYRRELFAAVGGYRLGVYGEDYDFWLRAMASGARHHYLPEPLSLHRMSPSQKSARLETVYRTDIRAVDECIQERERLIAQVNQPWRSVRSAAKRIVVRLLGRRRARRLYFVLKSMIGRVAPR